MPLQTNARSVGAEPGAELVAGTTAGPNSSTPTAIAEVGPKLIENRYLPIAIRRGEKRPENARWQGERLTPEDCGDYHGGAGILCGQGDHPIIAMDIDTTNADLAEAIERWCLEHLGDAPIRIGNAPKRLLVYRAAEAGWRKQRSRQYRHGTDERLHHLEVLGAGQQFVGYGIHPGTGRPYEWVDLMGGLTHWPADELAVVTAAQVVEAVAEFQRLAESAEYQMRSVVSPRNGTTLPAADPDNPFGNDPGPIDVTDAEIVATLDALDAEQYDQWNRVGMALYHQFDGDHKGLDLWDDWSSKASSYADRNDLEMRWGGFAVAQGVAPTTWRSVLAMAKEAAQAVNGRAPVPFTPVVQFAASDVPPLLSIARGLAIAGCATGLIAPPGVGKSAFAILLAVAVASGRSDLIGHRIERPSAVWLLNNEDGIVVLKRRLLAAMQHNDVSWGEIDDRLVMDSGTERPFRLTERDHSGALVASADLREIEQHIREHNIKLLVADPWAELHGADENSNVEVLQALAQVRAVAARNGCAVILVHHTRKPPGGSSDGFAGSLDSARGASSFGGALRVCLTLEGMSEKDAKRYGLSPGERIRYVRLDDAKATHSLIGHEPRWFRKASVVLDNGDDVVALAPAMLVPLPGNPETRITDLTADVADLIGGDRTSVNSLAKALSGAYGLSETTMRERITRAFQMPHHAEDGRLLRYVNGRIDPSSNSTHWIVAEAANDI